MLDLIEHRIKHWLTSAHILIGGDFNITLNSQIDRWPPGRNSSETTKIKSLMDRYGLVLGGKTFFWYTKNLKTFHASITG